MLKEAMFEFGLDIFDQVCKRYGEDLKQISLNIITDSIESILVGKRTIDEWADIVIKVVDNIKDKTITENDFKYIGGILKFSMCPNNKSKVIISYELYFIDGNGEYFKNSANSDVNKDNFVDEDIIAISEAGEIIYEVEE